MAEGSATVSSKASDKFFRHFQQVVNDLQNQIQRIEDVKNPGSEHADAIEHCLSGIARLSNEVNEASSYLAAYDQRTYSEAVNTLKNKLQQARSSVVPKPRFAFKSKPLFTANKNESAISVGDVSELSSRKSNRIPGQYSDISNDSSFVNSPAAPVSPANEPVEPEKNEPTDTKPSNEGDRIRQPSFSQSTSITIANYENIHIILPASASHATTSGTLSNLRRSVIDLSNPTNAAAGHAFAGLTLKDISSSLILCGRVSGAAHLTNVRDSVVVVTSRQFRMHASSGCDVYLSTASRPIIEDCSGIRFAKMPGVYVSELDREAENRWESVDDFNWLREEASPNWRVLGPGEGVEDRVWREVVPGGPGVGVDDILRSVNIRK